MIGYATITFIYDQDGLPRKTNHGYGRFHQNKPYPNISQI